MSKVNPTHYDGDRCMRLIANLGLADPFCIGTAIKYLWRVGRKESEKPADDLGKVEWYLDWLLSWHREVGKEMPMRTLALMSRLTGIAKRALADLSLCKLGDYRQDLEFIEDEFRAQFEEE